MIQHWTTMDTTMILLGEGSLQALLVDRCETGQRGVDKVSLASWLFSWHTEKPRRPQGDDRSWEDFVWMATQRRWHSCPTGKLLRVSSLGGFQPPFGSKALFRQWDQWVGRKARRDCVHWGALISWTTCLGGGFLLGKLGSPLVMLHLAKT